MHGFAWDEIDDGWSAWDVVHDAEEGREKRRVMPSSAVNMEGIVRVGRRKEEAGSRKEEAGRWW